MARSDQLYFDIGKTTAVFHDNGKFVAPTVTILDDKDVESDETFKVTISMPREGITNKAIPISDNEGLLTIQNVGGNNLPTLTIADQTFNLGMTKNISSLVSATDADGDAITQYEVKDTTGADNFMVGGSAVNATSGYAFAANQLSSLTLKADASASSQTLEIRAHDGKDWGDWTSFTLNQLAETLSLVLKFLA